MFLIPAQAGIQAGTGWRIEIDMIKPVRLVAGLISLGWVVLFVQALLFAPNLYADDISAILSPATIEYQSREAAEISIFFHNKNAQPVKAVLPEYVRCILSNGQRSTKVKAVLISPLPADRYELGVSQFVESRYRFSIPENISGAVRLHLVDFETTPILITVSAAEVPVKMADSATLKEPPTDRSTSSLEDFSSLYQPYIGNVSPYEPIYFLVGTDPEKSKFQISFKYQVFDSQSSSGQQHAWLQGLHFGYTQTSFWDLQSDSAPFEDTSYKPELYYITQNLTLKPDWMKGLFIQTGARHESNGRGGESSRSTNTLYLNPTFIFFDPQSRIGLQVSPRLSAYVRNNDDTNPNLPDYRGYFDLQLKAGKAEGLVLGSSLRLAQQGASVRLDLTYPLHRIYRKLAGIYLQAQYSDALAESLIDYQERTQTLRFGVALVR